MGGKCESKWLRGGDIKSSTSKYLWHSAFFSSEQETSEEEENEEGQNEKEEEDVVRPETLTAEELEKLKEAVEERKKLIQGLRGKPWPMNQKHVTLK